MSLADAIKRTMDVRDVPTVEVARRMGQDYDRATFYRLATGVTTDPRLGTLIVLCRVLDVAPTELLHLAGCWPASDHPGDTLDLHLRAAFTQVQALPTAEKQRAATLIAALADAWDAPSAVKTAPAAAGNGQDEDAA